LRRHDQRGWKDTYRVGRIREIRRVRRRVRIGAPDASLTRFSGAIAVTELVDRLAMIKLLDAAIGPIKSRDRGFSGGQLLVGIAAAQLAGEDFLVGLDRQRADEAGQVLAVVPGLASTTAAGLARKFTDGQWHAVETGLADVAVAALAALAVVAPARAAALCETVTIDLDTTDVEVYGRKKRGVAFNYQGQRVGRPHVATWADTATVLAADLMSGRDDPRATPLDCCCGRSPRSRPQRGAGGSGCAPTPATLPGSWPARRCSPTPTSQSSSPSAPAGSRRCGGSSTVSPRPTGPMRST
jgi:hypothetical protein